MPPPPPAVRRHRLALQLCFAIPGLSLATWVTRTPDVRDRLDASTAEMGLVLSGMAVGSMLGILVAGALVARFATRPVVVTGMGLVLASVAVTALGAAVASAPLVTLGLFLIGSGMGLSEVASNVDGSVVEREYGRPVLPALHGCYSLGTVVGAVLGVAGAAAGLPVPWHLAAVLLLVTVLFALALPGLRPGLGRALPRPQEEGGARGREEGGARERRLYLDPKLLLIGGVLFALTLAEGAATDWLPLLMVDGHDMPAGLGSAVYAGFAATMAVGRFAGGPVVTRFGRPAVLGGGALLAAAGIALVSFSDAPAAAGCAVLLWGLGTALGFPLALAAAGESGPDTTGRIALTSRIGYVALLAGPPVLGLLGEHLGLRAALVPVLLLVLAAAALSPATGPRRGDGSPNEGQPSGDARPPAPAAR
ncbi:MFS transporter [Kitasatospora sp. NPDC004272]